MICDNITVKDGVLHFAGQSTVQLAQQYGTPLYLLDEDYIRRQCRVYKAAFARHFGPTSRPLFASKACCFTRIYEIMREEGMGIDVVSPGEIYTARRAGFDLRGAYFHGNNKTDADIAFAMECAWAVSWPTDARSLTPSSAKPPAAACGRRCCCA